MYTGGEMGECPDWYTTVRAAHYYGIGPWELTSRARQWTQWALMADNAERSAQTMANKKPWNAQ